jgi:hypothetical protein
MSSKSKITLIIIFTTTIIIGIGIFVFLDKIFEKNKKNEVKEKNKEIKVFEVLVAVREQENSDPVEDKRNSMKKGYVIGVYPEGHSWSDTEKISYLILKMNLTEDQKMKLTQSIEQEISLKDLPEEEREYLEEADQEEKKEVIGLRKYKIDLEEVGFSDPNNLLDSQPFEGKTFDWEVVEEAEQGTGS